MKLLVTETFSQRYKRTKKEADKLLLEKYAKLEKELSEYVTPDRKSFKDTGVGDNVWVAKRGLGTGIVKQIKSKDPLVIKVAFGNKVKTLKQESLLPYVGKITVTYGNNSKTFSVVE
jgi:hypothetical protein